MDEASTETVPPAAAHSGDRAALPTVMSGVRTVGVMTFLSRILGLARDIAMAAVFGAGHALDTFTLAFRIPNMARRLFGEGAFTSAFLPGFVRQMETGDRAAARELSNAVFFRLAKWLVLLTLAAELAILLPLFNMSLRDETRLLLKLLAVLTPYVILVCLTAHQTAVLHSLQRFALPAFLPVLLNLVWLIGLGVIVVIISPVGDARLMWLGGVVLVCGFVQLASAAAATQSMGWGIARPRSERSIECDEIFRGMWPVVIGMSVTQINGLVDSLLAWWLSLDGTGWGLLPRLPEGTASALYFGQRLQQFPLGVIGVSLGTVLFPRMSKHVAGGELSAVREDLSWGLRFTIAICVPASVGLVILAGPITEVLFQRGEFDAQDSLLTSRMVAAYGVSVWASVALLVLHRAFYSLGDRTTPLRISLWIMFANLLLNLVFVKLFLGVGLAWATTVTTIAQAAITMKLLEQRTGRIDWQPVVVVCGKTLVGVAGMWAVCGLLQWAWPATESSLLSIARLATIVLVGGGTYFAIAKLLRLTEATSLLHDRQSA